VAKEFGVTIDIEDPYTEWIKPPERYIALGASYQQPLATPLHDGHHVVPMEQDRQQELQHRAGCGDGVSAALDALRKRTAASVSTASRALRGGLETPPFAMAQGANATPAAGSFIVDAPSTRSSFGRRREGGAFSMTDRGPLWGTLKQSSLRDITRPLRRGGS